MDAPRRRALFAFMNQQLHLVPIGPLDAKLLASLRRPLEREFGCGCHIAPDELDPQFAFHAERGQYHSSEIVARLRERIHAGWRVLGITAVDLYIPILTFVFGEAEMEGRYALVSLHRLRQEFYGLPPDANLIRERTLKECVHELGHTLGLTHCENYTCAMASSHSVEWIDLKGPSLCRLCRAQAGLV